MARKSVRFAATGGDEDEGDESSSESEDETGSEEEGEGEDFTKQVRLSLSPSSGCVTVLKLHPLPSRML